jgi:hypothetical protein
MFNLQTGLKFQSANPSLVTLKEIRLLTNFKIIRSIHLKIILTLIFGIIILASCSVPRVSTTAETPTPATSTTTPLSPSQTLISGPLYTPSATPFSPTNDQMALMQYALELINADRVNAGLNPVSLGFNAAAQKHAKDMFDNYYWAHWGTDGLKPYMRYTLEGGLGYDKENVGYTGSSDRTEDQSTYAEINLKNEIKNFEYQMMNNDAQSNWGHKDNILFKWHQKVNLGLAYNSKRLALVQQFEGDYVDFIQPPTLTGNILSLSGQIKLGELNNISVCYDQYPQPISPSSLISGNYHSYSLGDRSGYIISPAPAGQFYKNLPQEAIQASKWETNPAQQFSIQADITPILSKGRGVYTVVLVIKVNAESVNLTNYAIFVN